MSDVQEALGSKPTRFGVGEVLRLAWPASLTMLNSQMLRFVDGLMVAYVSPEAFNGQFMGGISSFALESFFLGMLLVVSTYVSQNLGADRLEKTSRYAWAGIGAALAAAVVVAPLAIFARPIFDLLHHDPLTTSLETMFFRWMLLSIAMTLSARVIEQFFYGVHRPRIVLWASLVANVLNLSLDWVLIYGHFGFPAMGLRGAAIATVISFAVQLAILLAAFLSPKMNEEFHTRSLRGVRFSMAWELIRLGWPAGLQFFSDVLCWTIFVGFLIGKYFGIVPMTASTIAMRYMGLSFMPAVGIGTAATALVGRYIGQGRTDMARRRTHTALVMAMCYMGLCALAFLFLGGPLISLFIQHAGGPESTKELADPTGQVIRIGKMVLICAAVFQLFDAVGIIYVGALRGAGDTIWPMIMTLALAWSLIIGGGLATVMWLPGLGSIGPWITASIYVAMLAVAFAWRFEAGKWEKIDLLGRKAPADAAAAASTSGPLD